MAPCVCEAVGAVVSASSSKVESSKNCAAAMVDMPTFKMTRYELRDHYE